MARFPVLARAFVLSGLVLLAAAGAHAQSQSSSAEQRKLDAWIGKDASQLLLEWRVDGRHLNVRENDDTGDTYYTFTFRNPAWRERVQVGTQTQMVGMTPGSFAGNQVTSMVPVHQTTPIYEMRHHPESTRCTVLFRADYEGVINYWAYEGTCNRDTQAPRR